MTAVPAFDSIDHLNYEAVAALIDDELSPTALHRARQHLAQCPDCRREVAQQRAAAEAVREHNADGCLRAPRSLVERLAHLDQEIERGDTGRPSAGQPSAGQPGAGQPGGGADGAVDRNRTERGGSASGSSRKWPVSWSRLRDGLK